jgi:hypothetical protein
MKTVSVAAKAAGAFAACRGAKAERRWHRLSRWRVFAGKRRQTGCLKEAQAGGNLSLNSEKIFPRPLLVLTGNMGLTICQEVFNEAFPTQERLMPVSDHQLRVQSGRLRSSRVMKCS